MKFRLFVLLAVSAIASGAFADDHMKSNNSTSMDAKGGPSDAEIAHILITANKGEIDAAKLAERKATNGEVKEMAKMMVSDHTAANKDTVAVANKIAAMPKDNGRSRALALDANKGRSELGKLSGRDFDFAYINQQIAMHQTVLDTIDNTLLPNARSPELKALLGKLRPSIQAHLDHAKSIQSKMAPGGAS